MVGRFSPEVWESHTTNGSWDKTASKLRRNCGETAAETAAEKRPHTFWQVPVARSGSLFGRGNYRVSRSMWQLVAVGDRFSGSFSGQGQALKSRFHRGKTADISKAAPHFGRFLEFSPDLNGRELSFRNIIHVNRLLTCLIQICTAD
jgi:hypothetical protein